MSDKKVLIERKSKIRWARLAGIKNDDQARQELRESQELEEMGPKGNGYRKRDANEQDMVYENDPMSEELDYEEDDMDMDDDMGGMDDPMGDPELDMDSVPDEPMGDPGMDMGMEGGGGNEALAADLAAAVADAIEGVLGVSVDVEGGDMGMGDDMGMEDPEMDMDLDEPAPDVGGEPEVDMEMDDEEPLEEGGKAKKVKGAHADHKLKSVKESNAMQIAQEVARILLAKSK